MNTQDKRPEELERIYSQRFDAMKEYRDKVWKILTGQFFQKFMPPDAHVLDLGCGYGEFINNIDVAKKCAMDLNPAVRQHLHSGITLFQQDCSAYWPLPDNCLDIVFTSNFFEHLPDKTTLDSTLAEALRCLKPGGKLIAMGPNIRLIPSAYWDFYDHYLPLSDLSLAEGLAKSGYKIEKCFSRFLPYTMARGRRVPVCFVKLYIMLPFLWKLKGRQFLIIAVK